MKYLFIILSALVIAQANSPACANEIEIKTNESTTRFDTLADWHSKGRALTFAEFKGFYTGRCFYAHRKDNPVNAFIGYTSKGQANDPGPGFPSEFKLGVINYGNGQPANYFDKGDYIADFNRAIRSDWNKISSFTEDPTLSYMVDWEANGNQDEKRELVIYNGYIIEKWTALIKQRYGELGVKNPGDVLLICYYFKQVGN